MPKRSAGLLIYRLSDGVPQVLLVHPGGPFWAKKDEGAWSIPKGLVEDGEDDLAAAIRETEEEIGFRIDGRFEPLGEYRQPGGKRVVAWAIKADPPIDPARIVSNTFPLEWPPRSGTIRDFPEVDRARWFSPEEAAGKILKGQLAMLDKLAALLADQES